jgi:cytochrome c oxidase cbb3-type subunit 4
METYSLLREFADSWFLIAMFAFFLGASIFAFWPSQKSARDDAAAIPLRDDDKAGCSKNCADCACKTLFNLEPENG